MGHVVNVHLESHRNVGNIATTLRDEFCEQETGNKEANNANDEQAERVESDGAALQFADKKKMRILFERLINYLLL